jgi:hypothetical protein
MFFAKKYKTGIWSDQKIMSGSFGILSIFYAMGEIFFLFADSFL